MTDVPADGMIEIPVIRKLVTLPYVPAHVAFLKHTEECERCHTAAFHPEAGEPFCLIGEGLHATSKIEILVQRQLSLLN